MNIKCYLLFLFFSFLLSFNAFSQEKKMNLADFEKRKVEYIKKEVALTRDEADNFFPLYNQLSKKKYELRKQYLAHVEKLNDESNLSEDDYKRLLNKDLDTKVKEAELDKEYTVRFEKILSSEKLFKIQQSEKKFMQIELQRFKRSK